MKKIEISYHSFITQTDTTFGNEYHVTTEKDIEALAQASAYRAWLYHSIRDLFKHIEKRPVHKSRQGLRELRRFMAKYHITIKKEQEEQAWNLYYGKDPERPLIATTLKFV